MPIPMTPGGDGTVPLAAPSAHETVSPVAAPARPAAQEDTATRPALATALPAWDLLPPHQVLTFRRRA